MARFNVVVKDGCSISKHTDKTAAEVINAVIDGLSEKCHIEIAPTTDSAQQD